MRRVWCVLGFMAALSNTLAGGREGELQVTLEREARWSDLLGKEGVYEASGVCRLGEDRVVAVFDNLAALAVLPLGEELVPGSARLVGRGGRGEGFEGVCWDPVDERLYAVIEEVATSAGARPRLIEFDRELRPVGAALLPIELEGQNKGVEGLTAVRRGEQLFLLALLEGNHGAAGARSKDKGHGRIEVLTRGAKAWERVATLELPPGADFEDYAGVDVVEGRIVVVSQSSRRLWVGRLAEEGWSVVDGGQVGRFPKAEDDSWRYDAVEGVAWWGPDRVICVSDGARGPDGAAKEQSLHVFRLSP